MSSDKRYLPRYTRRRLATGVTLLLFAALLTLLPFVLRQTTLAWLHDHGVPQATFRNIDLNLFTGTLAIEGLNSGDGLKIGRLAADLDWWPLLRGQLDIRSITLEGAALQLDETADGRWLPAGLKLPAPAAEPTATSEPAAALSLLPVLHSLQLRNIHLALHGRQMRLELPLDSLSVRLEALHDDGHQELALEIATGTATFQGFGYTASDSAIHLQAKIDLPPISPQIARQLKIHGLRLHAGIIEIRDNSKRILASLQRLNMADVDLSAGRQLKAGDIRIGDLDLQPPLAAGMHFSVGSVACSDLDADLDKISAQLAAVDADSVTLERKGFRLLKVGALQLKKPVVSSPEEMRFDRLQITSIGLPTGKEHALGSVGSLTLAATSLDSSTASVERIDVDGADVQLLRNKEGHIALLDELVQAFDEPGSETKLATTDPAAENAQQTAAPTIKVGEIAIGKGSRLQFIDRSVAPAFDATVTVDRFSLSPLQLPAGEPSRIDAQFTINDHATLALAGSLLPAASPKAKLDLNLKRLDMAGLSGYLEQNLGQAVQTGQLDLNSKVSIAGSQIDAGNKLTIRKLVLKPAKDPGKTASLGMPMDMALDMLRDSRGDIQLEVPVTGDLKDPKVNINDAINQALLTAMQAGAVQYATQLLQPYGSLITVAKLVGKVANEAAKPRLTPIRFAPQSEELSPDMRAYSGKLAELLKEKDFRLQVCGVAMQGEAGPDPKAGLVRTLDQEALLKLAGKRSATVIQSLTAQGIDGDRLFHCRDQLDAGRKGEPRVELILD